jgi:hypothetical protein
VSSSESPRCCCSRRSNDMQQVTKVTKAMQARSERRALLRVGCHEHMTHDCSADLAAKLIWVTAVAAVAASVPWRGITFAHSNRSNSRPRDMHPETRKLTALGVQGQPALRSLACRPWTCSAHVLSPHVRSLRSEIGFQVECRLSVCEERSKQNE